jgi:hypothetical protein
MLGCQSDLIRPSGTAYKISRFSFGEAGAKRLMRSLWLDVKNYEGISPN